MSSEQQGESQSPPPGGGLGRVVRDLAQGRIGLARLWGLGPLWQVRLRWLVPPGILAGVGAAELCGYHLAVVPLLAVAALILIYNIVIAVAASRRDEQAAGAVPFAVLQVVLDYAAMFLLIHFTGGPASPLIFFFIFHVIFAGILLRRAKAFLFGALASVGVVLLAVLEQVGLIDRHPILYGGQSLGLIERPAHMAAMLVFFVASIFITALSTTAIMGRLRAGVLHVAEMTDRVTRLNERLNRLYDMLRTIGAEKQLDRILAVVTEQLARMLESLGVAVKLLDDDARTLRYVAAHGLPEHLLSSTVVEVARSPLNRRVIEGETLVHGRVGEDDAFQLNDVLLGAGIRSVMFAPLIVDERVIGILGAYSRRPHRFADEDSDFFRLAAEIVAITIENGRQHTAVRELSQERLQFMLRVAHNMRAPLGAAIGMLDAIRGGYLGEPPPGQAEYLERVSGRLANLNAMVGELLTLARRQERAAEHERGPVQLDALLRKVEEAFGARARERGLELRVAVGEGTPPVIGDAEMLQQMLENLVSNALKYTPRGARVDLALAASDEGLELRVSDTGIGIPEQEQPRLFTEFFRASNAKTLEQEGTGLGLVLVKQTVEQHGGRIALDSAPGRGTTVTVQLPA